MRIKYISIDEGYVLEDFVKDDYPTYPRTGEKVWIWGKIYEVRETVYNAHRDSVFIYVYPSSSQYYHGDVSM